jgi:hypothetical protein
MKSSDRAALRRVMEITRETAAASRRRMVAAMDRLEGEISSSCFLVGESFTVADLTAAALFSGVSRPLEFPYPMVAHDDPPASWRDFIDPLAQRPGGQSVAETYQRYRARSAETIPAEPSERSSPRVREFPELQRRSGIALTIVGLWPVLSFSAFGHRQLRAIPPGRCTAPDGPVASPVLSYRSDC